MHIRPPLLERWPALMPEGLEWRTETGRRQSAHEGWWHVNRELGSSPATAESAVERFVGTAAVALAGAIYNDPGRISIDDLPRARRLAQALSSGDPLALAALCHKFKDATDE